MMYTKEASLQEEKVEKIKAEAGCEHVIRKQVGTASSVVWKQTCPRVRKVMGVAKV